jgi:AraC family transcriptional regulator, arabinose operon regulatory protein
MPRPGGNHAHMDALPAHHRAAADLPGHWITLPASVRTMALAHPLLRGLFPSHVGFFPEAAHHRVDRPLGLDQATLQYCVRGRGWCEVEGRRFEVEPGELLVVPRHAAHAYGADQTRPWTVYWLHAMGEHVDRLLTELGASRQRPVVPL